MSLSITEAFYQLRQFLNLSGTTGAHHECLDTIHAEMERLEQIKRLDEKELQRLRAELEQWHQRAINAEHECFELSEGRARLCKALDPFASLEIQGLATSREPVSFFPRIHKKDVETARQAIDAARKEQGKV